MNKDKTLTWTYGLTTVPERKHDLLPRTLASLTLAGFPSPRLFVDGATTGYDDLKLSVTYRSPRIKTYANWLLGLQELYLRDPTADRYAMFQDDFVTYPNLRLYLERTRYPNNGYCNLYSFPSNESFANGRLGWYEARTLNPEVHWQTGRGAVALVFNLEAVLILLRHQHIIDHARDAGDKHKKVDGAVVSAMNKAGWREFVHSPSLVQHTGLNSSMGNRPHKQSASFMGEDYDALDLLPKVSH